MKSWLCEVCGYIHEGETPPEKCPVCGVGSEKFTLMPAKQQPRRWKCTVCDYIHVGDAPPETCPVCGVGKENFVLLANELRAPSVATGSGDSEPAIHSALDALSYGLYIVTSTQGNKINGQTANTVFQVTSVPPQIAICLNKRNLTHEYVSSSGVFAVSILSQEQCDIAKRFGYQSGRNLDKFAEVKYFTGNNGCPVLADCSGYMEAVVSVEKTIDVGTHTMFIAQVTSGGLVTVRKPLTYAYYKETK